VAVRAGETITLRVDTSKVHVFDPATTQAFV
jgi:hypothetical protein